MRLFVDRASRDHPRVRGEKNRLYSTDPVAGGSPPRTRGEVTRKYLNPYKLRITPAYAGRSYWYCISFQCRKDHPRVRGEKKRRTRETTPGSGSPPRTRGEATESDEVSGSLGITPAYAGRRDGASS